MKLTKKRNKKLDINKYANYNEYHIRLTNMLIKCRPEYFIQKRKAGEKYDKLIIYDSAGSG